MKYFPQESLLFQYNITIWFGSSTVVKSSFRLWVTVWRNGIGRASGILVEYMFMLLYFFLLLFTPRNLYVCKIPFALEIFPLSSIRQWHRLVYHPVSSLRNPGCPTRSHVYNFPPSLRNAVPVVVSGVCLFLCVGYGRLETNFAQFRIWFFRSHNTILCT